MAADKYRCKECIKNIAATGQNPSPLRYRKHDKGKGAECLNSRTIIPAWLVKRGPESDDGDVPAVGRDYAPCPGCQRSPRLDKDGRYTEHAVKHGVLAADREQCPMSGQPYEAPEGETCPAPDTPEPEASAGTACAAPSSPASGAPAKSVPSAPAGPNESEEMISKWAATARGIEDRKLPPSPESTTTQPNLPPPRSEASPTVASAPADTAAEPVTSPASEQPCHITAPHPPHRWMLRRQATQCPGKLVPQTASTAPAPALSPAGDAAVVSEAAPSGTKDSKPEPTPPDIEALARIFPRTARIPLGMPGDFAPPGGADVLETATPAALPKSAAPTSAPAAGPSTAATPPTLPDAPPSNSPFARPGSPFSQPGRVEPAPAAVPMTLEGERIASALKQMFFDYCNRTERSQQKTLGPSGIGTPCDRKIAMTLLDIPAVNPGWIDKWASFVGTAIHAGLAEVFEWANAGTGRYATEMPLTFPSASVPKGTGDLLDRTYASFMDHKSLSAYGVKKFKEKGPPLHHRIQVHTYAYGARLRGEVVDHVVIIGWPREGNSLNDLCVWTERYDPQIARDALARVDRIAAEVKVYQSSFQLTVSPPDLRPLDSLAIARRFDVADDCRFCPFHAPGDVEGTRGCNGRT